jgi:hypothetical protein
MAKARATLGKKERPSDDIWQPKTVELWCDTCHAKWTEGVLSAWVKCPFVDCKGTLRNTPPPGPPKASPPKDTSMPLLSAIEASDDAS